MYYVYVLESLKYGKLYVGFSTNLKERVRDHLAGKSRYTKTILPVKLIFYEAYIEKSDAKRREKYFKTTKGKTTLRTMISNYLAK